MTRVISRGVWTANFDGTLALELLALGFESRFALQDFEISKVAIISHDPSVSHMHLGTPGH